MLKNKWLWIGIILFSILLIGGKIYMDNKEENKNKKTYIEQVQQDLALFVVQNYEDVEIIVFSDINFNKKTGFWSISIVINDEENNWLVFSISDIENEDNILKNMTLRFNPKEFTLKESKDSSRQLDKVTVIYGEQYD